MPEKKRIVPHCSDHSSFIAAVDMPLGVVGQLSDGRSAGRAQVQVVWVYAREDFAQDNRGVPLQDLSPFLVFLNNVSQGIFVKLKKVRNGITKFPSGLLRKAKRIELSEED